MRHSAPLLLFVNANPESIQFNLTREESGRLQVIGHRVDCLTLTSFH